MIYYDYDCYLLPHCTTTTTISISMFGLLVTPSWSDAGVWCTIFPFPAAAVEVEDRVNKMQLL